MCNNSYGNSCYPWWGYVLGAIFWTVVIWAIVRVCCRRRQEVIVYEAAPTTVVVAGTPNGVPYGSYGTYGDNMPVMGRPAQDTNACLPAGQQPYGYVKAV